MTPIEALHAELDFQKWEPSLRLVTGIWSSLQNLQRLAKTPAGLKKYRAYLERCIHNLKVTDFPLTDDETERLGLEWSQLYDSEKERLAERAAGRLPNGVEAWCQRWLPKVYEEFSEAMSAFITGPTKRNHDRLMESTRAMFREFEQAI